MKVAIFAGGFGTRLSEETTIRPKPMVEVGSQPILWHIMKMYAHHGFKEFVVLGGYKVDYIRRYFLNYRNNRTDYTIDLKTGRVEWLQGMSEDWKITVLDTGADTMTGGRLKRAMHLLADAPFCLTYGDGVSNVNITALVEAHRASTNWCTLTAVTQPGRYGALHLNEASNHVIGFREKGATDGGLINGGFFVCQPEVFELIEGDQTTWENEPMERMIQLDKLGYFHHKGYWQSMDSLRDRMVLEAAWAQGAPWKVWKD
ncbi:glucose-1-phosphate cytidylyltransferase [Modicisalibacter ilicicola DSM 19980]|uniref:Glucose-1-phosphate cytidylyltransferase n=1 Tax=Modicisalibacter ilicicola DSM 19980 TaxID=1121942 RepID=A0A1M5BYX1_9GAMM|nr:glucose-1-phosphate cytidylyltransferase [Halomonas ilicicola]SHF47734.1 glucose-1-phosphate cytidylyltransferase [Halomonas ilicicola DSM 19980]